VQPCGRGIGRLGWKEIELAIRPKREPGKQGMAARLRQETPLSIKAIASLVQPGTYRSADARLHADKEIMAQTLLRLNEVWQHSLQRTKKS
jgi:hypothetical protein